MQECNHGRARGMLTAGGRDVGATLISEGLAKPYVLRPNVVPAAAIVVCVEFIIKGRTNEARSFVCDCSHGRATARDMARLLWFSGADPS